MTGTVSRRCESVSLILACHGGGEKWRPRLAALSTSSPWLICPRTAHNQTVTDRRNVVKSLFVGNLGSEVTPEELRRLFEAYGQVGQVHIVRDRDTGLPRGFAFVEMKNEADAEKAIKALNCSILRDCALNVSYARPRPEPQQRR